MSIVGNLVGAPEDQTEREDLKKRTQRKNRACADFGYFCSTYLSDYFFTDPAAYMRILYDVADTRSMSPETAEAIKEFVNPKYHPLINPAEHLAGALFIEPREHGKTVRWSFAYPLWRVLSGRSRYVLLIGASKEAASENLINIRTELEENELIQEDFGELKGARWSDSRIELTLEGDGACIQAKGAGMSMRGTRYRQYRPDYIALDDILKDDAIESPTTRSKIHRWFKRVVMNLGKKAFIVWVNTIFHSDDPPSRLMQEIVQGTLKRWIAVRLSCFRPDGEPLWPENWPKELLDEKREQVGSDVFATEYENEPMSEEDRIIRREWIERWWFDPKDCPPITELRTFGGVDPATGKHDGTGIASIGIDKAGIIWVLDAWARTCSESETVTQLCTKQAVFRYELIAWEEVVFSGIYANLVVERAAALNIRLPIKKVSATQSKSARLRSISALLENGVIRIPQHGCKELIEQLTTFPKGKFDDLCDALAHAVGIAKNGPGSPVIATGTALRRAVSVLRGYRRG